MKNRVRARIAASRKAKRVPATFFILILLCLSLAGAALTARLLPVGATAATSNTPQTTDELWQEIAPSAAALAQSRALGLDAGRVLRLNREALAQLLSRAPHEFTAAAQQAKVVLPLPLPDGTLTHFRLEESPVLVPELAAQYPEIKSYSGQGIDDPTLTMRCNLSPQGFHAAIITNERMITIQPQADDVSTYVSYSRPVPRVACDVKELERLEQLKPAAPASSNFGANFGANLGPNFTFGATLRTYRIGISTTQEYTNDPRFGGGTVAGTIASINTWISGVNAIYERELSIRLLVTTNNALIFMAEPDGYTNGEQSVLLNEVRPKLRDLLGVNNYDVGHVLATTARDGAAGVATLGGVCENSPGDPLGPRKGQGGTVFNVPPGDPVGVAVLAHEIAHMFNADHTYNTRIPPCAPTGRSAWEPGGGSTVMAGGCGADVLSRSSQIRFHVGSKIEINNYLSTPVGSSCGMPIATGNNPPNVNGGPDFTIPKFTPFTLTATGSDPDVNDLSNHSYIWEQMDAGNGLFEQNGTEASFNDANDPPTTTRPIFRVFVPTASPARTFPSLTYILNNANDPPDFGADGFRIAEELPRIGRTLNFRVTLSDNRAGGSGVTDDLVTLTVAANAGPFLLTAPNTGAAWPVGSRQTVNWSVANTNAAPINCANVRILLSTDGGQTFPLVLAAATPNDGAEDITVPNGLNTTTARLKVEAVGNIFFDISDVNFAIISGAGCPQIASVTPNAGTPGSTVTLTGRNFTGVTGVRFGGNLTANFTIVSDAQLTATVPAGAVSGPLTLSKTACPEVASAAFTICTNAPESLQVDDESPDDALGGGGYFINRLTPTNYPATLSRVLVRFAEFQRVPAGTPITIVAGTNTDGDANIDNTALQTIDAQVRNLDQFVGYDLARPLTINSGDFVVGYRIVPPANSFPVLQDKAVLRNRSYGSSDGVRFEAHAAGNFLVRAEYLRGCGGGLTCPTVTGLSATNGTPGSTVTITGANFSDVTAVRFGGNAAAAFTVNSSAQISATVPANAATGPITISRAGCPDAQTANFTVVPIACPTVTGINPAKAAPGSAITITGANLSGVAIVKFGNEASANFTVNSDTQITAIVPPTAATGPLTISRTGCPNVQTAAFFPCGIPLPPLQIDDGGGDTAGTSGAQTLFLVNRLTPANYPARLDSVQIHFAAFQNIPAGTNITVLAGANADGDANIDNTAFQTMPAQVGAPGQFTNYNLTTPLTINSGDFIVGFSLAPPAGSFPILRDTTTPRGRSYSSTNGTAFALDNQANFLIRGQYSVTCDAVVNNNPAPTLASLAPVSALAGGPGFDLTVNGANFINGSVVRWNRQDRPTTFVSATQLRIAVPAADIAQPGTASVTVFNPAPGGGVSNAVNFNITGPTAPDTIALTPGTAQTGAIVAPPAGSRTLGAVQYTIQAPAGATSLRVQLNGNQDVDLHIRFGQRVVEENGRFTADFRADSVANNETIDITPASNPALRVGTYFIAVVNWGPGAANFTVNATVTIGTPNNPVPALTSLSPNAANAGGAAFTLTLNGTNFVNGSVVRWNGQNRTTTFVSATQLTAAIPATDIAQAGTASITVFTPVPGGGVSNAVNFTITTAADTVVLASNVAQTGAITAPAGGGRLGAVQYTIQVPAGTTALRAQLNGNQDVDLFVRFGQRIVVENGGFVADFRSESLEGNETINITPASNPALRAGTYFIAVANFGPGAANFTVTATLIAGVVTLAPAVTNLIPNSVTAGGATLALTVNGENFTPDSVVRWNTQPTTTTFVSTRELRATIPAVAIAQVGTANVTVLNPTLGQGVSNAANFTMTPAGMTSVSAASFAPDSVLTANSITAAFGQRLATATLAAEAQPLPTSLAGTSVRIRDAAGVERLAPLFFVSAGQINYLVPEETANGKATVTITSGDGTISQGAINVQSVAPGLFTANSNGQGVPAAVALRVRGGQQTVEPILQFDQAQNRFVATPIELGPEGEQVFLILFGGGFRNRTALAAVNCAIGGANTEVSFAGEVAGLAGLDQANVLLPRSLIGRGNVEVVFRVDGKAANTVTINIK